MFNAATWYEIEERFKLIRQIEQVIYELASDFMDVWLSPTQLLYMAQKLNLKALSELGKKGGLVRQIRVD